MCYNVWQPVSSQLVKGVVNWMCVSISLLALLESRRPKMILQEAVGWSLPRPLSKFRKAFLSLGFQSALLNELQQGFMGLQEVLILSHFYHLCLFVK
ncbi:Uncharacterized protein TCM_001352 [Theobroma cacao]|uniref:Uncharacterized protein n=1 Tax=Theobroma cacao TaxID=3641 RepID=A0A061DIH8_THECC|nr:Uncharacterized protein TCM_001352 [Theobroma cacao]